MCMSHCHCARVCARASVFVCMCNECLFVCVCVCTCVSICVHVYITVCFHIWLRHIRSISYVLLLSGAGYFIITILYIVIDMFDWWNGAPFIYPGTSNYYSINRVKLTLHIK